MFAEHNFFLTLKMEPEQIILSMHQGGMHLTVETTQRVLDKMAEIRSRNPELWKRKDLDLLDKAEEELEKEE